MDTIEKINQKFKERFASKYELVSKIGAGGHGSVYLARETLTGAESAVKVM